MPNALDPDYRHRAKTGRPGPVLSCLGATLKWYDLEEPGLPVTPAVQDLARAATLRVIALQVADHGACHGFAIAHRCGASFHFLLINLWQGNNELWQAVHHLDAGLPDFAPFAPAYPTLGAPRPTYCVWELGIVAFEALAWQRLLNSPRDAADFANWQRDTCDGPV